VIASDRPAHQIGPRHADALPVSRNNSIATVGSDWRKQRGDEERPAECWARGLEQRTSPVLMHEHRPQQQQNPDMPQTQVLQPIRCPESRSN
jgi:hypothetical protein